MYLHVGICIFDTLALYTYIIPKNGAPFSVLFFSKVSSAHEVSGTLVEMRAAHVKINCCCCALFPRACASSWLDGV